MMLKAEQGQATTESIHLDQDLKPRPANPRQEKRLTTKENRLLTKENIFHIQLSLDSGKAVGGKLKLLKFLPCHFVLFHYMNLTF